ncbi:hypothetical protein C8J57DRAFT_1245915 [Mycena rebaudengoi]|nr:hypothetical protein C8J57DRAFT_1245915 [Mycena rebaudengoi]
MTSANGVSDVDTSPIEVIDVDACDFPGCQRFFTFEGKDWYPINVDSGSTAKDAISVEAWTTLSEAPGSLADGPAAPSSSEVWAQARADKKRGHIPVLYLFFHPSETGHPFQETKKMPQGNVSSLTVFRFLSVQLFEASLDPGEYGCDHLCRRF